MKKFLLVCLFMACADLAHAGQLNVVTTTADLKSITEFIGGDRVKVESLGKGTQNYHFLAAKPSFMIKARNADLFIRNGLDLEIGYEPLVLEGSRNPGIQIGRPGHLDASGGVAPLDVPDHVDRSMGDVHPGGNPHYWTDPENAKIIAGSIARRLSELDPAGAGFYQSNLADFNSRIDAKLREWQEVLLPYKNEKLITYHKSWVYFAERFGFEVVDELEPKPGVPPGPGHLQSIINAVRAKNVRVILQENIYDDGAARFISEKTGAAVVVAPISVGGMKGADDYFSLMDVIVERLREGFST